jgi:hypothetical protein
MKLENMVRYFVGFGLYLLLGKTDTLVDSRVCVTSTT